MIFDSDEQAIQFVREHQKPSPFFVKARDESKELFALVDGLDFTEELIERIEHIESEDKKKAREKYSRSIKDLYGRLFQPITNVFNATGGVKKYEIENEEILRELITIISRIRGNKSLQKWIERTYIPLYHSDPNGLIFVEYLIRDGEIEDFKPTYKSVKKIRYYEQKGQLTEVVLFEPKILKGGNQQNSQSEKKLWRLVDDVRDRFILQQGEAYAAINEPIIIEGEEVVSFDHPFGEVPAIIISDISKIGSEFRISPMDRITDITKEYARDQSIKTLFKFLHGFPIHWRYVSFCKSCQGTGKTGGKVCTDCNGKGKIQKKDITDIVELEVPEKDQVKIDPIAGFISPDNETWSKYDEELKLLEQLSWKTHWGTFVKENTEQTATEIFVNVQPVIGKLNEYADAAEYVEWKITEWLANLLIPNKNKTESIASISYGRRYIIESLDTLLEKYIKAREAGAPAVILDRMLEEYITAKYQHDPDWLRKHLIKTEVEPYVHLTIEQVQTTYGEEEARKKGLFEQWWRSLTPQQMLEDNLIEAFDQWIEDQLSSDE